MKKTICPKCNYKRTEVDNNSSPEECPKCGIIYEKYYEGIIKKLNEQNKILIDKVNEFDTSKKYIESKLENALSEGLSLKNDYEEKIKQLTDSNKFNSFSFKSLLVPLWVLVVINISIFGYEFLKTGEVKGVAVTPVYIQGVNENIPVTIASSNTLPVSINYVSGNIPVAIKEPLAYGGSVCANPCR